MARGSTREFWDARAVEDPFYFVDTRQSYGDPDLERFWAGGREVLDRIDELLGVRAAPDEVVVEIGCGVGRITRALAATGARVVAVDVSRRMIERAKELNADLQGVEWLIGDGESLAGIDTASADGCLSIVVFQHIPNPEVTLGYIREMGRVLRPGGWAAFQISNDPEVHRRRPLKERLTDWGRALTGRGPRGRAAPEWLGSSVDLDPIRRVAAAAGMAVERVTGEGTQYCLVRLRRVSSVPAA